MTGDDYDTSGVAARLLPMHRVIVFDRPGFGHSARPRDRLRRANEQADLLHAALRRLGVARPVVVGHSWGAIVALALAVRHQADIAGLVLVSGYYFWTPRPDVLLVGTAAILVLSDILRYTLSPVFGWLTMPLLRRLMFAPAPVGPGSGPNTPPRSHRPARLVPPPRTACRRARDHAALAIVHGPSTYHPTGW